MPVKVGRTIFFSKFPNLGFKISLHPKAAWDRHGLQNLDRSKPHGILCFCHVQIFKTSSRASIAVQRTAKWRVFTAKPGAFVDLRWHQLYQSLWMYGVIIPRTLIASEYISPNLACWQGIQWPPKRTEPVGPRGMYAYGVNAYGFNETNLKYFKEPNLKSPVYQWMPIWQMDLEVPVGSVNRLFKLA